MHKWPNDWLARISGSVGALEMKPNPLVETALRRAWELGIHIHVITLTYDGQGLACHEIPPEEFFVDSHVADDDRRQP